MHRSEGRGAILDTDTYPVLHIIMNSSVPFVRGKFVVRTDDLSIKVGRYLRAFAGESADL